MIDTLLRNDLLLVDEVGFAPLDDTGAQLLFRFVSAAYERRSLGCICILTTVAGCAGPRSGVT